MVFQGQAEAIGVVKKMRPPLRIKFDNDFQTPPIALAPVIPFLDRSWVIWECAEGKGYLTKELRRLGFTVIGTDILSGKDFLSWTPKKFDCIITNPPYSQKEKFLQRCYDPKKPFALLLPLTALESEKRQNMFREYGLQLILLNERINFETPFNHESGSWFATAWFTKGFNLTRDLTFVKMEELYAEG